MIKEESDRKAERGHTHYHSHVKGLSIEHFNTYCFPSI